MDPTHNGMARPMFPDRGDNLQIRTITENIRNKSRGQTKKGGPAWVLGERLKTLDVKKKHRFLRNVAQGLEIGRAL